jgi:hypothetical protein
VPDSGDVAEQCADGLVCDEESATCVEDTGPTPCTEEEMALLALVPEACYSCVETEEADGNDGSACFAVGSECEGMDDAFALSVECQACLESEIDPTICGPPAGDEAVAFGASCGSDVECAGDLVCTLSPSATTRASWSRAADVTADYDCACVDGSYYDTDSDACLIDWMEQIPDSTAHTNSSCARDCALDCAADFFVCRCPWAFIGFLSVFVLAGMLGGSYFAVKDMRTRERFKLHQEQGAEVSGRCIARRVETGPAVGPEEQSIPHWYNTVVFSVRMLEPTPTAQHILVTKDYEVNQDNFAEEGSVVQINHLLTATGDARNAILVSQIESTRANFDLRSS